MIPSIYGFIPENQDVGFFSKRGDEGAYHGTRLGTLNQGGDPWTNLIQGAGGSRGKGNNLEDVIPVAGSDGSGNRSLGNAENEALETLMKVSLEDDTHFTARAGALRVIGILPGQQDKITTLYSLLENGFCSILNLPEGLLVRGLGSLDEYLAQPH